MTNSYKQYIPQRTPDEGSGLIDIRAMQAALAGHAGPMPSRPGPAMQPASTTPVPVHVAPIAAPSQRPLYGLVVALMFGLASLTAFVLSEPSPSPPPSPRHTPSPRRSWSPRRPRSPSRRSAPAEPAEVTGPVQTVETTDVARPASRRKQPPRTAPTAPPATRPQTALVPASKPAATDDETMKCLLGGTCKVERPAASPTPAPVPAASSLPERLSDTDITAGTSPAKARATSSCARLAQPGDRVKIKLSIAGPTGTVISARAEDDGGNPALATCAAAELEKASFKPVQRAQMGALVTLKF